MINDIIKIAKTMKKPIVYIAPTYMLGTDEEFCTLSRVNIESDVKRPMAFKLSSILLGESKDKYANEHPEVFFTEYSHVQEDLYINTWNESFYMYNIMDINLRLTTLLSYANMVYSATGLEKDVNFMQNVAKLKVSDGMKKYIMDGQYLQTSFNKVHAINASDTISLNIYDMDSFSYLYEYRIGKKKYDVYEYIRYRKMNMM